MEIIVETKNEFIELVQSSEDGGIVHEITVSPDQVDQLIEWLKEAKAELEKPI